MTIDQVLTRGVSDIFPTKEGLANLLEKKKIRLYQGFDPTGPQLHLGHAVALRKLRQFQDLGHQVIFLIGDFTAMVGDPSGKSSERRVLTKEEVLANAETYKEQASRILRFDGPNPVEIKYNSSWLEKMTAIEFFRLTHHVTYNQIVERDMFQERMKKGQDLYMNEFLYPFMQGYDSVAMDVDLEIGGSDQMFNMLMGRKLMHKILKKEKFVMTVPLLTDSRGVKLGKTEGNAIGIADPPNEFYSKMMGLGDDAIIPCFTLLTDVPMEQIEEMKKKMQSGENPMDYKKQLAFELTKQFNDEEDARNAQENFTRTFQKRESPVEAAELRLTGDKSLVAVLEGTGLSKSEIRRLMEQSAIDVDGSAVKDGKTVLAPGMVVRVGKKAFYKIIR